MLLIMDYEIDKTRKQKETCVFCFCVVLEFLSFCVGVCMCVRFYE